MASRALGRQQIGYRGDTGQVPATKTAAGARETSNESFGTNCGLNPKKKKIARKLASTLKRPRLGGRQPERYGFSYSSRGATCLAGGIEYDDRSALSFQAGRRSFGGNPHVSESN